MRIDLGSKGNTLSTRLAAKEFRSAVETALSSNEKIEIDLSHVEMMTSGFSDELFGVLWDEIGDSLFHRVAIIFPTDKERAAFLKLVINKVVSSRISRKTKQKDRP